ncbi:MAG: nitrilase family protein [Bacteroidales bacterium]|nr:nitrilase family protein [Candidatus Colimorpha onthohippi]
MRITYLQQDIIWENPKANYESVSQQLETIPSDTDIIIPPETFSIGFSDNMAQLAEYPQGETYQFAQRMAQRHDALFVATWTVKDPTDGKVYNRMHWVQPNGDYGYYDKGHTFRMSSEASQIARGSSQTIFEWRGWRIKPAICYDLRFPKWNRNSVLPGTQTMAYDLLIVCANWPASRREAWTTLIKARAIENLCYVAGINRMGCDGTGIPYAGDSAVIDYKGMVISQCVGAQPTTASIELSKSDLETFRSHWPFYLDFD